MKKTITTIFEIRSNLVKLLIIPVIFSVTANKVVAQTATLFFDDFEDSAPAWTRDAIASENAWFVGTCAGNGSSETGINAAYITDGIIDACGETYNYVNTLSGSSSIVFSREVNAYCGNNLELTFDYRIEGNASDFGEVVYSTDGGFSWTSVGTPLVNSPIWSVTNRSLPALLEGTVFHLGFRFTYDNTGIDLPGLAIDNVLLEVTDLTPPVLNCPVNDTVFTEVATCTGEIGEVWKRLITVSDNCTDSIDIIFDQTPLTHTLNGHLDNIVVDLIAYDEAGNTATCQVNIVLVDAIQPAVICPTDFNVNVNSDCEYDLENFLTLISPTDNCSSVGALSQTQSPLPGITLSGHGTVQPITLLIEDEAENVAECNFEITLIDAIDPVITCPNDTMIYANSSCEALRPNYTSWPSIVVNDNCSNVLDLMISQNLSAGGLVTGLETIELTVADEAGLTASCQFNVDFIDTLVPSLTCPTAQTLATNADCEASLPDYQIEAVLVASDNCSDNADLIIQQIPAAGTLLSTTGLIMVEFEVTDESGNVATCQFDLDVIDNINPSISCPSNQTVTADINCQETIPDYTGLVTVVDNCSSVANISLDQDSPISILSGASASTTVTITATDEAGNDNSCQFDVTLIDNIAPEITCNGPLTFSANSDCEFVLGDVTTNAVATDNCTAQASITKSQNPLAGTTLGIGVHTITIIADDNNGNTEQCSFQLTVEDNTDPNIITCAPNTSINADPDFCNGTLGDYRNLVNATDNCTSSLDLSISQSPTPSTVVSETTTVFLTVADVTGNSSVCSFVVALIDNTVPILDCPSSVESAITSNCDYLIPDMSSLINVTDNCSAITDLVFDQTPAVGSASSGITNVTVNVTDEGSNVGSCIVQVTALDITPPTISCPGDDIITIGSDCTTTLSDYTSGAVATDNCFTLSLTQSPTPGTEINTGNNEITIIATDAEGNEASCSFNLLVTENIDPEIICPDNIETCDPVVVYTTPIGTDNCAATTEQSDLTGLTSGDSFPLGTTIQSYTVSDPSGNEASCSFNVTVFEFPDEAILSTSTLELCDTISTIISANQPQSGTGEWIVLSGAGTLNNQFANITGVNNLSIGVNEIIWTVSSAECGTNSDTLTITVYELPLPASTVDTVYACDLEFVQLTANQPSTGTGLWYDVDGNALFSDPNSVPTNVSNLNEGWNQIVWSISNGSCPLSTDTANVYKTETAEIIFPDSDTTVLCLEENNIALVGTEPAQSTAVQWYFIEGSGLLSNPFDHECNVTAVQFGTNVLVYEMKKQQCPATRDTAIIIVNTCSEYGDFPNMITPNGDGQNDVWVLDNLNSIYPDCVVRVFNRWGNLVFESEGYLDNWDGTHNGERLPMGTYYYTIDLNDAESSVIKGYVSIVY